MQSRPVEYPTNRAGFAAGVVKEQIPRHWRRAALSQALRVARTTHEGQTVECAACGSEAASFLWSRFCVECGANARTRLIALFLRREIRVADAPMRILHFAPEPGLVRMLSALDNVDYVPGDLHPDKGHAKVDATAIDLEPGFDGVITSHVLEHIDDDAAAMREMHRILKPGGWAVVLTPVHVPLADTFEDPSITSRTQRNYFYGQHDHVRVYGRDFVDRLKAAGLDVVVRRYARELSDDERDRFGVSGEPLYFCTKP